MVRLSQKEMFTILTSKARSTEKIQAGKETFISKIEAKKEQLIPVKKPQTTEHLGVTLAKSLFPPLAFITPPPAIKEQVYSLPQVAAETIFPPTSIITGQLPAQTFAKAQTKDIIATSPFITQEQGEAMLAKQEGAFQEGKPAVMGGGTTIIDVAAPAIPDIGLPDFGDIGKYGLIAVAALGGLYLLGRSMGGN